MSQPTFTPEQIAKISALMNEWETAMNKFALEAGRIMNELSATLADLNKEKI